MGARLVIWRSLFYQRKDLVYFCRKQVKTRSDGSIWTESISTITSAMPVNYCFITSLYFMESRMSMFASYGSVMTAGSRLRTYGGFRWAWRWTLMRCMKVVLPEPAIPTQTMTVGVISVKRTTFSACNICKAQFDDRK